MNLSILEKANIIVNESEDAYIATIDQDGFPSCSTISSIKTDGIFKAYFSSGTEGNKALRIRGNPKASVCYHKGGDNVTLIGTAWLRTDPAIKHELWQPWFINHFPGGETDPTYCIIEFTPERTSLWIDREVAEFSLADALTVQSRCGLLCNHCSFKEPCHCGGCIETNGNPFHGECPVAACCQQKGFTHCGQCPDMPCEQLYTYSCLDKEHGDKPKGARISMLKHWGKA